MTFEDGPIKVELIPVAKGKRLGYATDQADDNKEAEKSEAAFDNAMELVYRTAKKVNATIDALGDEKPTELEIDFGVKLDEDGKAAIIHSGVAGHFRVKLKWEDD